jgi:hypothetical protein
MEDVLLVFGILIIEIEIVQHLFDLNRLGRYMPAHVEEFFDVAVCNAVAIAGKRHGRPVDNGGKTIFFGGKGKRDLSQRDAKEIIGADRRGITLIAIDGEGQRVIRLPGNDLKVAGRTCPVNFSGGTDRDRYTLQVIAMGALYFTSKIILGRQGQVGDDKQ